MLENLVYWGAVSRFVGEVMAAPRRKRSAIPADVGEKVRELRDASAGYPPSDLRRLLESLPVTLLCGRRRGRGI